MMKIYIYTDRESGKVRRVDTITPANRTDEQIRQLIDEYNAKPNNRHVEMIEVSGKIYEAFKFLLGDEQYRRTYTLTDLIERVNSLKNELEDAKANIESEIWDIDSFLRETTVLLKEEGDEK
jgi:hypothetical protein